MIETRLLESFLVVAEELHFGRAADRLHLTQPPLTRQIQQLEEQLGDVLLFDRRRRRIALTEAGDAFVLEARRLLENVDAAVERTQRVARGEAGQLRIGFVSTADYSVLPALLREFRGRFPAIHVDLLESTADEQARLLAEGALDAALVIATKPGPGLTSVRLYQEPLVAVLPKSHPHAKRSGALPTRALAEEPFVLFPRSLAPDLYDTIIAYTRKAGFAPKIAQDARQMQTIIGLVAGGLGVSIVPACMRALRRSDVAYRTLSPVTPNITTHLVWRSDDTSNVLGSFLAVARSRRKRP